LTTTCTGIAGRKIGWMQHTRVAQTRRQVGGFGAQLVSATERGQQALTLMWSGGKVTTTFGRLELSWILARQ
jgi:hypothetical protein